MFDSDIPESEQTNFKEGVTYGIRGKRCIDSEDMREEYCYGIAVVLIAAVIAIPAIYGIVILFEKLSGL
jgi:hypothetical protein